MRLLPSAFVLFFALFLTSCGSSPPPYQYQFVYGRSAIVRNGQAIAPSDAPEPVKRAIAAGNQIVGRPYIYGGGHRSFISKGYDCSGTASYVLHGAGLLTSPIPSDCFRNFGKSGPGNWMTIYARRGHVFMVVAGLRIDTGYNGQGEGPRWSTMSRPTKGCVLRHPQGL